MKPSVSRTFLFVGVPLAIGIVALIFGSMELRHYLLSSTRFTVTEVDVLSTGVSKEEIKRRAGILPGTNIFSLDLDEVKARVEKDPWVHSATVVRALPNKIQITYVAQVPKAILGADSQYYLNSEGAPFYKIRQGDSLQFPFVQVEGQPRDKEKLRQRVEASLRLLDQLRSSKLFTEKDLGDLLVRVEAEDGAAPYLLSLRYPPRVLGQKKGQSDRLYTVSFGEEDPAPQVKRWEAVVRHLVQQGKNPRLIRLELGKKVVVKVER